ncbi:MAG: hypothetical protein A2W91_05910 [Bacteroidetes bacterium GWF2_38_335]|nr:MAG: hypothetical protein A2W91_05910 [Bacteroidetes bacterium GWF2_38_335]OFY81610.1 MAG: hypothetical protein A2281_11705 [Bacteroidetes bacterium RIFOXYA12_FULL_38_20]HBS88961.1 hypothetical protein [Bacteroidales bacterium]
MISVMIYGVGQSQDTLLLMNGKIICGEVKKTDNKAVYYCKTEGRMRIKKIDVEDLFSISYNDTKKDYFYKRDTSYGYYLQTDEMYVYLMGQNYAHENFKAPLNTFAGVLFGVTGGVVGFWGMTIPATYIFLAGSKDPHFVYNTEMLSLINTRYYAEITNIENETGMSYKAINEQTPVKTPIVLDPLFQEGYNYTAKDKKVKNSIKGGVIGFISLVAASYLIIATQ